MISGEIDIIEGVNSATSNSMTLHTGPGCSIDPGSFTGLIKTTNCDVNAPGQGNNVGCGIGASGSSTYGDPFNSAGGGVYATEWTSSSIAIYFFPRSAIPADITSGSPNPAGWGEPVAQFGGGCSIPNTFKSHNIVFDTTFCGDWAGAVWSTDPVCSKKAATCNDYVQNHPTDFAEAYWEVNSVKVYQQASGSGSSPPPASSSKPAAASSSVPVPSAKSSSKASAAAPSAAPSAPPVAPPAVPSAASYSAPHAPAVSSPAPEAPATTAVNVPEPAASSPATISPDTAPASSSDIPIPFPQSTGSRHHHHHPKASGSPPAAMLEIAPSAASGMAKGFIVSSFSIICNDISFTNT
jgi:hypothetical protein